MNSFDRMSRMSWIGKHRAILHSSYPSGSSCQKRFFESVPLELRRTEDQRHGPCRVRAALHLVQYRGFRRFGNVVADNRPAEPGEQRLMIAQLCAVWHGRRSEADESDAVARQVLREIEPGQE